MSAAQPQGFEEEIPVDTHAHDLYRGEYPARLFAAIEAVDAEALAFFAEQGYLAIEAVFTPEQVEAARQGVWDLVDGANPEFRGVQFEGAFRGRTEALSGAERRLAVRKLMRFVDCDARLQALAAHPPLLDLVERLMGGEKPVLFQDMALLKPPGGREKPWHQDCAYFNIPLGTPVIGAWIALDEATLENGCLHILPGTHREGPVLHFKRRDWQICDAEVQKVRDHFVPLPAGGCLIWHGLLHHGSPTNRTGHTRRALQFHYKPESTGGIEVEERMRHFGGEVNGAEC